MAASTKPVQPAGGHPLKAPVAQPAPPGAAAARRGIFGRLLHGTGAGTVAYLIGTASNLVLLPLYLRTWSVAVYGEWMALYSVVNYLANLDFGVTAAAVNAATMAYARGDWEEFKRIQGTAWAASLSIALCGVVLVVAPFLVYFRVERWLHLTAVSPGEARLVFCCLAVALLANIPGRQLISIYVTVGEYAKYQWIYNAFLIASCCVTAAFLIAGAGPSLVALAAMGTALLTIALAGYLLHRRDPRLLPRIGAANWNTARALAAPTAQFGISIAATILTLQAPVVLLSRALGGPSVALFTTTRTVANIISATAGLVRAPLRPELAALSARRSMAALGRLFRFAMSVDAVIRLSLFAGLWSGGSWLIRLWSRGRIAPDGPFLRLVLVSVLLEGFLVGLGSAGWAANRARALSLAQIATAVTSLILAAALIGPFGVSAVPMGTLPPLLLIMAPIAARDACERAGLSARFVVLRLFLPFVVMALSIAALPQWLTSLKPAPDWFLASCSALIAGAAAAFVAGSLFLTRVDRQNVRDRVVISRLGA